MSYSPYSFCDSKGCANCWQISFKFPSCSSRASLYRNLERDKTLALACNNGNFDAKITISAQGISELQWWATNVINAFKPTSHSQPSLVITTDASLQGWGAECQNVTTGGLWSHVEAQDHINYLELLATFFELKTFAQAKDHLHIRLMIDNTSAVAIINNMGTSHSERCNTLAKQIWEWCI